MKKVICQSGLVGWQDRIHRVYKTYQEFVSACGIYYIHRRLGFKTVKGCWRHNPIMQASVNPGDCRRVFA